MLAGLDPRIAEAFGRLPDYLGGHVAVSLAALLLGLAISLPLALAIRDRPGLRQGVLAVASTVQTIPGLALLALFYPLLLALAALSARTIGFNFSALGFLPAMLALALYSMLPVLRNTIAGLDGIDPAIREATLGVGMTPRQALVMVEIPLALPVIMAGIRTAAVWVIGTATLSTPIGYTSLGNYIFTGLQTQNWVYVLFGCVAAALLALAVDQLLALAEAGIRLRSRWRLIVGAAALVVLVVGSLAPTFARPTARYLIGAKPFAEQYILAALIEQRLAAAGLTAARREGLGSTVAFDALASNEIDIYVEYSGTIWTTQMGRSDVKPRDEVLAGMGAWLRDHGGIAVAGNLGFENAYALGMTKAKAGVLNVRSIADLAARAPQLSIAGDYEFFGRPEWKAIEQRYGLTFKHQRTMQAEFMYPAVASGDVDVISAYTSDGRVARYGLTLLADPAHAIPPYDAIILLAPKRTADEALAAALRPLVGAIDVALMQEANLRASAGGEEAAPEAVARWMWGEIERKRAAR